MSNQATNPLLENAVFISGASQRVGFYVAKQFLEHTNLPVIFSYRSHKPQVDELIKLGAVAIQADFDSNKDLNQLVEQIQAKTTSLRAVIHNASIWLDDEKAPVFSDSYQSLFRVHVDAPLFLNEALVSLLNNASSDLKDIIAITDVSMGIPKPETIAYLASKAALSNMTQSFAKKYAPSIKVNDIAPGLIMFNEGDSEDYKQKRLAQSAIGIEPGPEVIWQAIQYLMNSPYTTGVSLPVNGGSHLM